MNSDPSHAYPIEIGAASFESDVLRSSLPVLVAFGAPWSHPCQILSSSLEEVAATGSGRLKVFILNADDNPDLSVWYEIESVPTLLFFLNGILRAKVVGTVSRDAILSKLQSLLNQGPCIPAPADKLHPEEEGGS